MSDHDRALKAAAERMADDFGMPFDGVEPYDQGYWLHATGVVLDRWLDSLLEGLPAQSIEALRTTERTAIPILTEQEANEQAERFLRWLRTGLGHR